MTPLEVRLFDVAWAMSTAIAGGGPLPHKTPQEAAADANQLLLTLLDERNAYGGLVQGYARPAREAACDVLLERYRQVGREGWSAEHDDKYGRGELARAAAAYATYAGHAEVVREAFSAGDPPAAWPWDAEWWKPAAEPRRNMVKAAALMLAEIERLDRAAVK